MANKTSKRQLLSDLRKLLKRPDTTIVQGKLPVCGDIDWERATDGKLFAIKIRLDPRRDGRVRLVIHELLHAWLAERFPQMWITDELEEAVVAGWENHLYDWLHSPKRAGMLENWNRAIERKMR